MKQYTYKENGKYYAIVTLYTGHTYYYGPFNSRSSAYRYAKNNSYK